MHWNYRIIRKNKEHTFYEIHEVYYDPNGNIQGMTENPIIPTGETLDELKKDFSKQFDAFKHPILDYDDISRSKCEKR